MFAKQRGRPKTTSDDLQRDMIIDAARRLFVERGYAPTKTDDIAAYCKISKQTLYRLFSGKTALFMAVVESCEQMWLDVPQDNDDLPLSDALLQIFRFDMTEEADRERTEIIRLVLAATRSDPELAAVYKRNGSDFSSRALASWLDRQCDLGRIRLDDSLWLAQALIDMVCGAVLARDLDGMAWPSGDDRRKHLRRCIDVFLNGVSMPGLAGISS